MTLKISDGRIILYYWLTIKGYAGKGAITSKGWHSKLKL